MSNSEKERNQKIIHAPWTPKQVVALNRYQQARDFHPYTCGGNRKDEWHLDGEGVLLATESGWVCPYCDYTQDWALAFSANYWAFSDDLTI